MEEWRFLMEEWLAEADWCGNEGRTNVDVWRRKEKKRRAKTQTTFAA